MKTDTRIPSKMCFFFIFFTSGWLTHESAGTNRGRQDQINQIKLLPVKLNFPYNKPILLNDVTVVLRHLPYNSVVSYFSFHEDREENVHRHTHRRTHRHHEKFPPYPD